MCFTYEIQVPDNYTALSGDLEVTVVGLLRTPFEDIRLELLEVKYVRSDIKKLTKREINSSDINLKQSLHHGALIKFIDTRNMTNLESVSNFNVSNESAENDSNKTPFKSLSRVLDSGENRIPQIKVEKKWTVLGSVVVPANVSSNNQFVKVQFSCGTINRGGHFGVKLTGYNEEINNLTNRRKNHKSHRIENNSNIDEVGAAQVIVIWI